jgi:glucokinase
MSGTTSRIVLAADIGGTNAKLALARFDGSARTLIKRETYASREYQGLASVVHAFLSDPHVSPHIPSIAAACFAVAGPVENGRAHLTNVDWQIDESALPQACALPRVRVINDFEAAALGIEHLEAHDLLTLQEGTPVERGERVVIGAGTGLGVGRLAWSEGRYHVHASEGGHSDFAPADVLQDRLVAYLRRSFQHVSTERVLSGAGLPRILEFLEESSGHPREPALIDAMARDDPAVAITQFALAQRDPLAMQALDVFVCAYGAFAGNMALTTLAHGGVYVAGGIAPKIAARLGDGTFIRAFAAKGRFRSLLQGLPVHAVMNADVGVYGALAEAVRTAEAQ